MIRAAAGQSIGAEMISTAGAAFTGAVTVYVTIDAGVQAIGSVGSGLCTAEGNGYFSYRPAAAETDGDLIAFTFIGSGAVPQTIQVFTLTETEATAIAAQGAIGPLSQSAADLISRALRVIGVLGAGETVESDDLDAGFTTLREMVDAWGLHRPTMHRLLRTVKTLANGTATYTIGSGGSINIVRPVAIEDAGLILDTGAATPIEIPLYVMNDQRWRGIGQRTATGSQPAAIYYDRSWSAGLGLVYVYPIPDVGTTQLVLYTSEAVAGFADLTTLYTFPPGYAKALRYNLARELAIEFNAPLSQTVERLATESLADIQRANFQPVEMGMDPMLLGVGYSYDIRSDT